MCFFSAALSPLLRQKSGGNDEESTELTVEVCSTLVPVPSNKDGYLADQINYFFTVYSKEVTKSQILPTA